MERCLKCGAELPDQPGRGRPRKYCGEACLKSATMEVRRLDARIAKLEIQESQYRINAAPATGRVTQEIARLESRLAKLVDAADTGDQE